MDDSVVKPSIDLPTHEQHSEQRAEKVISSIDSLCKGSIMSHEKEAVSVKNIFEPGSSGGGNIWAAVLPALMAERGGVRNDGFGSGLGGAALGFVAGALVNNRRGGLFGGESGEGCGQATSDLLTLKTLGDIKYDIASSANETQAVTNQVGSNLNTTVLQQTIALQQNQAQLALGVQQGFAGITANIQATSSLLSNQLNTVNTNLLEGLCSVKQTVRDDGDKTRALITSNEMATLNRQLATAEAAIIEQRNENRLNDRTRGIEINMTNTQTQLQAQAQGQIQAQQQLQILANLNAVVANLANDIQVVRQGQTIFNSGTMAASGTQAAANTRVN